MTRGAAKQDVPGPLANFTDTSKYRGRERGAGLKLERTRPTRALPLREASYSSFASPLSGTSSRNATPPRFCKMGAFSHAKYLARCVVLVFTWLCHAHTGIYTASPAFHSILWPC